MLPLLNYNTVAVIGLGYVGLPLAVELAKVKICCRTGDELSRRVLGFDVNVTRLDELRNCSDRTNEISSTELRALKDLEYTNDTKKLDHADVFIITVPTPIDSSKQPDLTYIRQASHTVGQALSQRKMHSGSTSPIVIYESTVYPGVTEDVCVPILEKESGLLFNKDFFCGYSPERINPGDTKHRITSIRKVTSGSTPTAACWIDDFYSSFIQAGTHKAPSIKVAEAAKVIENTQRDLNIALVNELAIIFRHMEIDTLDVLDAAASKWNFLPFRPGLVGGHCIGVDPYYLTYKSEQLGYYPHLVLAGRRINNGMASWVVDQLVLEMCRSGRVIANAQVLVLGLSFKENCPDIRNTLVIELINSLKRYGMHPIVVDPWVDPADAYETYGLALHKSIPDDSRYDVVIAAVAHNEFTTMSESRWRKTIKDDGIFLDFKGYIPRCLSALRI